MELVKKIGPIGIFLIGFGFWISILFQFEIKISSHQLEEIVEIPHLEADWSSLLKKDSLHPIQFAHQVARIESAFNQKMIQMQAWDRRIFNSYTLPLARKVLSATWTEKFGIYFFLSFGLMVLGGLWHIMLHTPRGGAHRNHGIYNRNLQRVGWMVGSFLIVFYIVLYFFPHYLVNWILFFDPLARILNGGDASQWFLYGFLYTVAVLVMGARMLLKYRDIPYQKWRTFSVMFFQTAFAFLIPEILSACQLPSADLKNMWPLDYSFFFDYRLEAKLAGGSFGLFLLVWGIALFVVGVPVLTYLYGKRWYCSWVCGCGGLAETLGDPYRQLSNYSQKAWVWEKRIIYTVLGLVILMTSGVLYHFFTGSSVIAGFISVDNLKYYYGFFIGSIFSGVVGTGFYPFMGNRVWCRFGCPLAACLGLVQKWKSRFRITTNGGQCISCGNCSVYCEQGIDVRAYAQKGEDIVRASCVGCGICSAVCPRGVLKLENK